MGLSARILVGLALGILTGLFFGEMVSGLKLFGDIFVKLLQITVLPYIMVSLIAGFARMHLDQAKTLALRGTAVLIAIWGLALVMIFAASLAFPEIDTASFFGSPQQPSSDQPDLLDLYLPANIFYSLSGNFVPAVVLFSILVGVALISVENKDGMLPMLDALSTALSRINGAIVQLTPYGIFAISAAAAGTMTIEELSRVQVYLVTYVSLALLVTFWVFPALVAALSGISYREVLVGEEAESAVDIIVPVSFNFPSLGKLLVLLFVLFAAWFTDTDISSGERIALAFNGLFSLFGSINVAVPYLLDSLRIPADMFQLFLVTGIVVGRFGAMLAALHIIVISVIGTLALSGMVKLSAGALLRYLLVTGLAMVVLVVLLRSYFQHFVPEPPPRNEVLAGMHLMEERVPAQVWKSEPSDILISPDGSRINHILENGSLRVGYRPKNLPCSFLAPGGKLVGFDVEMAHILAQDLGVELEFVPFEFADLPDMMNSGQVDIAMSCIASLPDRYAELSFSRAYLDLRMALIVPDYERKAFGDLVGLRERENLSIAMVNSHYFSGRVQKLLPNATLVYLDGAEAFFAADEPPADALLFSAEEGSAYTYRYPRYAVVPTRQDIRVPAGYALPKGDLEMVEFISNWIELKRKDGSIDSLYDYWMLGGAAKPREPRWSIIRDVLGWVD
jgi:Na+/H+-dicarboxylate symporter/ABC-type amino acid transport substrate-binding protein